LVDSWFPGHMVKARREISENLKLVDVVIEILDARAPQSTRNLELENMCRSKPVLMVLNKIDLVGTEDLNSWVNKLNREGFTAVGINAITGEGKKSIIPIIEKLYQPAAEIMKAKKRRIRPPRVMVVGIPNVGKSTFLNSMVGKKMARTGSQPGVTRGKQWVRVEGRLDLLDTPGLMWPRISEPDQGLKLAALAILGQKAYTNEEVARYLIRVLQKSAPQDLEARFGITGVADLDEEQVMEGIARFRGFADQKGYDHNKTAVFILGEFRKGRMARIVLDEL